ncbi:enoyl-CoA hydratase [Peribacillus sp. SCS-155]|uniref:enoyl-CoA hydratase n=1 Tax=Peribacillus sedimenti TaxID=3115297 RepID=UPI003905E7B6
MTKVIDINKDHKEIAVITLNREEAANALSVGLLHQLGDAIAGLQDEPAVRCIIVTGSGQKAFCAGADLKERAGMAEGEVRRTVKLIGDTISALEALPQPVIAAINGSAFGGGLELALACDIRIASAHSRLGLTETSLGIIPGAGGTQRLPRLIGTAKAKELILTARRIDVNEAERLGIISKVTSQEELMQAAWAIAKEIAKNAPLALKAAKKAINLGMDTDLQTGLQIEGLFYGTTISSKDRLEGLKAFKEKRSPVYTGE